MFYYVQEKRRGHKLRLFFGVAVGLDGGTERGLPSDFPNAKLRVVGGV